MPEMIKDGTGTGNLAKVDANNRLHVQSVVVGDASEANLQGDAYNINTGEITLTDANETPVLYLKNNETKDLIVSAIAIGLGPSTGGSGGIPKISVERNPTAGTIVDNASAVSINSNRNYGSSKTLTSDAYKGATGNTMTNGTDHLLFYQSAGGRLYATIDEVLPNGKSIGITITPQSGNTSMTVYAAIICHLNDPAGTN